MPAAVQPLLVTEIDFANNPTSGYYDQLRYADGLSSYWRLNSISNPVTDDLGNNPGTLAGTLTLVTGALPNDSDQALSLNGTSNDIYVPDSATLTPASFSLEGWVKVSSYPGSTKTIAAKAGSYSLQINSSGNLIFTLKNDTTVTSVQGYAPLPTGVWHHIVCTYDGTTMKLYIDGVLDQSGTHSAGLESSMQPLRFAAARATTSPSYQSTQTATGTGTAFTVNAPAAIASGDILTAHLAWNGSTTTITEPTGWILLASHDLTGTGRRVRVYYKIATGSEPASYTWTASASVNWLAAASRFTGADSLYPLANPAYGALSPTSAGATIATGSHLPNVDNNIFVALFAADRQTTFTEDNGTERYDFNDAGANTGTLAMSTGPQASASALSFTGTAANNSLLSAVMLILCGTGLTYTTVSLDDWTLWNIVLTEEQVAEHYQAQFGGGSTYIDISTDVKEADTSMGRQYELNRIEAGGGSALVEDVSRAYDPANTSSPYAPNVLPLRKIRLRFNLSSVLYPVAKGFIERYPSEWEGDYEQMRLTFVDGFEPLSLAGVSGTLAAGLSGAQINRLLDLAKYPRADRAIDAGQFVMAGTPLTGDALSVIQDISDSELGVFFIDPAGIATFHDFAHRFTATRSTTSQATFSNVVGDGNPEYSDPVPSFDKDKIVNEWIVSTFDGTTRTAIDPLSISRYWRRTDTRATRLTDPADAQTLGNALLQDTATPARRFDSLTIQPIDSATWTTVLGLTISDRVTVIAAPAPAAGGPTDTKDYWVEGIAWTASSVDELYSVALQLSPCRRTSYYETIIHDAPVSFWRMDTVA